MIDGGSRCCTARRSGRRLPEFGRVARDFLDKNPRATVVHIGCGLDARFQRVDNGKVRWFDLDLPDVIALRKQLLAESERNCHLACSVLDPAWMDVVAVPGAGPFLFVPEAVLVYFDRLEPRMGFPSWFRHVPGMSKGSGIFRYQLGEAEDPPSAA